MSSLEKLKLIALTPTLRTWDIPGSIAFYHEMLGFSLISGNADSGWACLGRDGLELNFSAPNEHMGDRGPAFSGSIYFRTNAVDELWQRCRDRSKICYPIASFEYGMREFAIFDNIGYLLQLGQEI